MDNWKRHARHIGVFKEQEWRDAAETRQLMLRQGKAHESDAETSGTRE